jgi:hypothetical protein
MKTKTLIAHPVTDMERAWVMESSSGQRYAVRIGLKEIISHEEMEFHGRCSCPARVFCSHLEAALAAYRDDLPHTETTWVASLGGVATKVEFDAIRQTQGRGSLFTRVLSVLDI